MLRKATSTVRRWAELLMTSQQVIREHGVKRWSEAVWNLTKRKTPSEHRYTLFSNLNYLTARVKYNSPADPYKLLWIDTGRISHYTEEPPGGEGLGTIGGGDWDRAANLRPIENHWIVRGIQQRFERGNDWENTEYYSYPARKFEDGKSWMADCRNIDEWRENRCAYVDRIYADIRDNGYRPETKHSDRNESYPGKNNAGLEVAVSIGRDGSIFLSHGGFHRFAIAKVLDIRIPVNVRCRSKRWQLKRDEVSVALTNGEDPETIEHADHPDMRDVIARS